MMISALVSRQARGAPTSALRRPGRETHVAEHEMGVRNRHIMRRRNAEFRAALVAEMDAEPSLRGDGQGTETWEPRHRQPARHAVTKSLIVAWLRGHGVGSVVRSSDVARGIGVPSTSGHVSTTLHGLAQAGWLRRVGYGRWLIVRTDGVTT